MQLYDIFIKKGEVETKQIEAIPLANGVVQLKRVTVEDTDEIIFRPVVGL